MKSIRIIYENKYIVLYIHAFQIVWREGLVNSNTRGLKMGEKLFDHWTITSKAKIKAAFLIFFFTSQAPSASGAAYVLRKISNESDFNL